jgi:hypothetical protein
MVAAILPLPSGTELTVCPAKVMVTVALANQPVPVKVTEEPLGPVAGLTEMVGFVTVKVPCAFKLSAVVASEKSAPLSQASTTFAPSAAAHRTVRVTGLIAPLLSMVISVVGFHSRPPKVKSREPASILLFSGKAVLGVIWDPVMSTVVPLGPLLGVSVSGRAITVKATVA